jgi:hypothetical protein
LVASPSQQAIEGQRIVLDEEEQKKEYDAIEELLTGNVPLLD